MKPEDTRHGDDLGLEEKRLLVKVARESLAAHLRGERPALPPASGSLAEARGAFVTLVARTNGDLRGCVGMIVSDDPLVETVARMAVAAGTQDGRFEPVTAEELPRLFVEISVLGPMRRVRPEEVEVGKHGLLVSDGHRRGVLLPQVPVEHGWDRETFLAHTCRKAHLPEDAWRRPEVELRAFTATVFGEHDAEGLQS
jgi:AmmeMemoRadiSam system protein A